MDGSRVQESEEKAVWAVSKLLILDSCLSCLLAGASAEVCVEASSTQSHLSSLPTCSQISHTEGYLTVRRRTKEKTSYTGLLGAGGACVSARMVHWLVVLGK